MRSNVTWRSPANPAVRSLSVGFSKRIQNNLCSVRRYMGSGQASYLHVDFGGGYDDQGEAVLNPIRFDAETTGWVDADNKDVNVQP